MKFVNLFCFYFPLIFGVLYIVGLVSSMFKKYNESEFKDGVSILIPCYNEAANIGKQLERLVKMDYPLYEIICVNDCSKDNTYEILKSFANKYSNIKVINNKENLGKSKGLNNASTFAKFDYLVVLDGDCLITSDSLKILMSNFKYKDVGIVTGSPKIINRNKLICKIQSLEYSCIISAVKKFQMLITGSCSTASGCYFAIRKDLFNKVGKFSTTHITEDIELSYRVNKIGYKVLFEERSICHIKAIEGLKGLIKQRTRWSQGGMEVLNTYKNCLFQRKMWFYILEQVLTLAWVICVLVTIIDSVIHRNIGIGSTFFILLLISNILIILSACLDSKNEKGLLKDLIYLEIIPLIYWMVSFISVLKAFPKSIKSITKGGESKWETIER